jgi:hypothetical protein
MNNQGKRPNQIKFSENIVFYGLIGIIFVIVVNYILKLINNL